MDTMCGDCRRHTEVVYDHATGDTLCSECGLVLESYSIDERSEWRTFADNTSNSDPNRVGIATNPLLDNNLLTTEIVNSNGTKPSNVIKGHVFLGAHNNGAKHLDSAFKNLIAMAERLGLNPVISGRGCELYKKVFYDDNQRIYRAKNLEAALGACLLVSCQQESNPRTVKEICSVVGEGKNISTKKDIMKAKTLIMKQLVESDIVDGMGRTIRASDLIKRFCSNLGIKDHTVMKAALEMTTNCEEVDIRRSPISIAAAVIYVAVQLNKEIEKVELREIVIVTNVAEGTIRNTYKDLYPHITKIVPNWYANEDAIKCLLCSP